MSDKWTDEQYAAYELGMQTEREHQSALSKMVMKKHEQALAAKDARIAACALHIASQDERIQELERLLGADDDEVLPSYDTPGGF